MQQRRCWIQSVAKGAEAAHGAMPDRFPRRGSNRYASCTSARRLLLCVPWLEVARLSGGTLVGSRRGDEFWAGPWRLCSRPAAAAAPAALALQAVPAAQGRRTGSDTPSDGRILASGRLLLFIKSRRTSRGDGSSRCLALAVALGSPTGLGTPSDDGTPVSGRRRRGLRSGRRGGNWSQLGMKRAVATESWKDSIGQRALADPRVAVRVLRVYVHRRHSLRARACLCQF